MKDEAGAPHTLDDPEKRKLLLQTIREVGFPHIAAAMIGVHRDTLTEWIRDGRRALDARAKKGISLEKQGPTAQRLAKFYRDYSQASAEFQRNIHTMNIADKNSTARMWTLKKLEPEIYGDRAALDVTIDDKSKSNAMSLPPDALRQIAEIALGYSSTVVDDDLGGEEES